MADDIRTQPLPGTFPVGGSGVDPEKEALRKLLAEQQSQGVEAGSAQQQEQTGAYTSPEIPAFFDQFSELTNASQTDTNAPQLSAYVDPVTGRIGYRYNYGPTPGVVTTGATVVTPGRLGRTDIPSQDEVNTEVGPDSPQEGTRPVVGTDPATVTARGGDVITGAGQDVPEAQGFTPDQRVGGVPTKGGLDPYGLDPTTYTGQDSGTFVDFIKALADSPIGTAMKGFLVGGPAGAIASSAGALAKQGKEDFQNRPTDMDKFQAASKESMQGVGGVEAPQPAQPTPQAELPQPDVPTIQKQASGRSPSTPVPGFTPGIDRSVETGQLPDLTAPQPTEPGFVALDPGAQARQADMVAGLANEIDAGKSQQASQDQLDQTQFDKIAASDRPVETVRGGFGSTVVDVDTAAAGADFDYAGLPDSGDTDFTAF